MRRALISALVALGNVTGNTAADASKGNFITATLTGDATLQVKYVAPGAALYVQVTQDGVGGHNVAFAGAAAPIQAVDLNGFSATPLGTAGGVTTYVLVGSTSDLTRVSVVAISKGGASSAFIFDPVPSVAVPDANTTISRSAGQWFIASAAATNNRTDTIDTVGAVSGDQIRYTRLDTAAFSRAIVNGGPAAGTLLTFAASCSGDAIFRFDGTNWVLLESSVASSTNVGNTVVTRGPSGSSAFDTVTLNDLLFPATEATPSISQAAGAGAGFDFDLTPMPGATPGVNAGGNLKINLGATVAGVSAAMKLYQGVTLFGQLDNFSGYCRLFTSASILLSCNGGTGQIVFNQGSGGFAWWESGPVVRRTDQFGAATTFTYDATTSSVTEVGVAVVHDCQFKLNKWTGGAMIDTPFTSATTTGAFNIDTQRGNHLSTGTLTGNSTVTLTNLTTGTEAQNVDLEIVCHKAAGRTCTINATFATATYTDAALATLVADAAVERVIVQLSIRGGVAYVKSFAGYAT